MVTCGGPPRIEKRAVRLADSKVIEAAAQGTDARIVLDAYVLVTVGEARTAWSQRVVVELRGVAGALPHPGWLTSGAVDGEPLLALPFERSGGVAVAFDASTLQASSVRMIAEGEATFIERL